MAAAAPVSQGPGLIGQMASTAAGVAIGSTVGNAVSGLLFGGGSSSSSEAAAAPQQAAPPAQPYYGAPSAAQQENWGANCQGATQQFTKCMDENNGNMQICNWYLEQLVSFNLFLFFFRSMTRKVHLFLLTSLIESLPAGRFPVLDDRMRATVTAAELDEQKWASSHSVPSFFLLFFSKTLIKKKELKRSSL